MVVAWLVCAITFLILTTMDDKLTKKIQDYLEQTPQNRNVVDGATLLLSLNRNRIFFQSVVRKPEKYADKVAYELTKHLRIRLDQQTVADIIILNKETLPRVQEVLAKGAPVISTDDDSPQSGTVARGKRADHEELPDEIKTLWDECAELWFKIKELFEQLKGMEKSAPCDRYEYLLQLDEADKKYRANMQVYDEYKPGMPEAKKKDVPPPVDDPATIAKKVGAARKYISDNKKKLSDLKGVDVDKYTALLAKVQERYDYLINSGNAVDAEQINELVALGLTVR